MPELRTTEAYLSLMEKRGLGPARLRRVVGLLSNCGVPLEEAFSEKGAEAVHRAGLWRDRSKWVMEEKAIEVARQLASAGVEMVATADIFNSPNEREHLPPFLFVKGNKALLSSRGVGFCGSRGASERGLQVAVDIAEQVAEEKLVCTSGGANGVDMAAHTTSLRAGGTTIVVLAEGLLQHRMRTALKKVYDPERTLLVSQFDPMDRWLAGRAMQRNGTICALVNALVLIEAKIGSGTFAAGEVGLEMGLPLFTVEYGDACDGNAGNRDLVQRGALPVRASRVTRRANLAELFRMVREPPGRGGQLPLLGEGAHGA